MKKACFFGIYDPDYSRNRVLKRAFEENGFEVIECRANPREGTFAKYVALMRAYQGVKHERFEHILVCFPGHSVMWLARILFGRRIIFDEFVSLYDSNVKDRKRYSGFHPRAWYDRFLDWSSVSMARCVLADTDTHIQYLSAQPFLSAKKFIRVLVGTDQSIFYPRGEKKPTETYIAHFHGSYIPLQGIQYIIEAASLLRDKNIVFRLIGRGQEYGAIRHLVQKMGLTKVEFIDRVPFADLPSHIAAADVCLGIFGTTEKARRVIPNKVYEYAAMGKPIITADTPAIREVFSPGSDVVVCKSGSGKDLAEALMRLIDHPEEAQALGRGARHLSLERLSAKEIGVNLLAALPPKDN